MKASVITRINIAASQADVFEYLTNLKYQYLWNPQTRSISSTERLKLGSVYETTNVVLGIEVRAKNVVTKFVPLQELQLENNIGIVKYRVTFKLAAKDNSTLLICSTTVSSNSDVFTFAAPIFRLLARRELHTDMQALKLAVENKLT